MIHTKLQRSNCISTTTHCRAYYRPRTPKVNFKGVILIELITSGKFALTEIGASAMKVTRHIQIHGNIIASHIKIYQEN